MRIENPQILLVDDNKDFLPIYEVFIQKIGGEIQYVNTAPQAITETNNNLFDLIICDVKLSFQSSEFGGIILADYFAKKFGANSVLLVSQYVQIDFIKYFNNNIPFLPKPQPNNIGTWFSSDLMNMIERMIKKQYVFIAMPFGNQKLDELYTKYVLPTFKELGFEVKRVDEQSFTHSIVQKIFELINNSHLVLLMVDGKNPNVFYEGGYAYALEKNIILCASSHSELPFDIQLNKCVFHKFSGEKLKDGIINLVTGLRKIN